MMESSNVPFKQILSKLCLFKVWQHPSFGYEKCVSVPRVTFWVGEMKYNLHLDTDGVLKCPIQANVEQVMHVQTLATPELWL